jgi:folate-binding protein YgfZ
VTPQEQAAAARRGVGLFVRGDRGLLEVAGADRLRWLDGMVSNDVRALAAGPEGSGCYALLLTRKGRIVADLHVLHRGEVFWLETAGAGVAPLRETLERFIIADRVELRDLTAQRDRLALEGPAAPAVLEAAIGEAPGLAPEACAETAIDGAAVLVAAYGCGGGPALQLFAPAGAGPGVAEALRRAGAAYGLVEGGPEALEILRIEAGVPQLFAELDGDVLPAEARLERAISQTKGCYTGQEIVARLAFRGHVNHLLVGFALEGGCPPAPGAAVSVQGRVVGEVTSACLSPAAGVIALGYVRASFAEPGTGVTVDARPARVAALPFAAAGTP